MVTPLVLPSVNAITEDVDLIEFSENTNEEEAEEESENQNEYDLHSYSSAIHLNQKLSFGLSKNTVLTLICLDVTTPPPRVS